MTTKTPAKSKAQTPAKSKARSKKAAVETAALINVVLDRSGSMSSIKAATIEGFNGFLSEQAKQPGAHFSLSQFDTEAIDQLYMDVPVGEVKPLDDSSFQPRGGTPLYDAVGRAINQVEAARPAGKVIFVIITDGQENSSREFTRDDIFAAISAKRKAGWEFVFMGADREAYATGVAMGVAAGSTYRYAATPDGAARAFADVSSTTSRYRSGALAAMTMPAPAAEGDQDEDEPVLPAGSWSGRNGKVSH